MTKHRKAKTRIVTKIKQVQVDSASDENKVRKEVEELETKKKLQQEQFAKEKAGTSGKFNKFRLALSQFGRGGTINKELNQKRQFLRAKQGIRNVKSQVELAKAQAELADLRKKNRVDFNSLVMGGTQTQEKKRGISIEDLY